jgi:hypothetical protein
MAVGIGAGTVDSRLAFLARAAARFELVEAGAMDVETAFDGLVDSLSCTCTREVCARWERDYPPQPLNAERHFDEQH